MKNIMFFCAAIITCQTAFGQIYRYISPKIANSRKVDNGRKGCPLPIQDSPFLDTSVVYSKFLRVISNNFAESMQRIAQEPEVDSVLFNAANGHLLLYAVDDQNNGKSIFMWAKNAYLRWEFDIYHDVYRSLFSFKRVKMITVFVNNQPMTALPCIGDYDMSFPPKNIMYRRWYIPCLDYGAKIDRDDSSNYLNVSGRIVSDKTLDKLIHQTR